VNRVFGWLKFALYAVIAVTFIGIALTFNPYSIQNFTAFGGFLPYGATGLFAAMPIAMFSFGGARMIPDFAEEAKDKSVLIKGLLLTVLGEAVIYVTFAVIFTLATDWRAMGITAGNWAALLNIAENP
jgi:amino acid transporter